MTPNAKTRAVHAALALLTLWPAVHLCLVARYDLSPWKLGGFGMYSAPRFALIGMEIHGRRAGGDAWEQLVAPSAALRAAATEYLERHRWLRRLASPDELVRLVRVEHPDWEKVRVTVSYPRIDPASARVVLTHDARVFE